jgi:hypothetical protein
VNLATMAKAKATELDAIEGLKVTADPRIASASGACVLVAPPSHDYTAKLTDWTLVVLSGTDSRDLRTFEILAGIAETLTEALAGYVESLTPGTYALVADQPPVPCMFARLTESN